MSNVLSFPGQSPEAAYSWLNPKKSGETYHPQTPNQVGSYRPPEDAAQARAEALRYAEPARATPETIEADEAHHASVGTIGKRLDYFREGALRDQEGRAA